MRPIVDASPDATLTRFWSWVDRSAGEDACWPWNGPQHDSDGYGRFRVAGRQTLAHRWILGQVRGVPLRWDDELREQACHHCDNPSCVNPAHLYAGDALTNRADCVKRGRVVSPLAESNAAKTHCPQGHTYTNENTYWHNGRHCRTCRRDADRRYRQSRATA